jgi:hypothetical protein
MSFTALSVFEVANSEFGDRRYDATTGSKGPPRLGCYVRSVIRSDEFVRSPRMTGAIAQESMCQEK